MEDFTFGIGLKSNKESNDFLRCLWSRISQRFGTLAWMYSPFKVGNTIFVGQACISDEILLYVKSKMPTLSLSLLISFFLSLLLFLMFSF